MKTIAYIGLLTGVVLSAGCQTAVTKAIDSYLAVADRIEVGQSKEYVLSVLEPTQEGLSDRQKKRPESYLENGKLVEIYFFRSAIQLPDVLTDDEFTPYVFKDGKLIAIGWQTLGGPKTQAIPRPEQNITIIR